MADIIMPKMSDSMEEGRLLRWIKNQGDPVEKGEPIAEIETDKANIELESSESGVLLEIRAQEGDTVPVGEPVAIVGPADEMEGVKGGAAVETPPKEEVRPAQPEAVQEEEHTAPPRPSEPETPPTSAAKAEPEPEAPPAPEGVKASPLARKIAQDAGVDLRQIVGTGPGGRIVEADVRDYIQRGGKPQPPAEEKRPPTPQPVTTPPTPAPPTLAAEKMRISHIWKVVGRRMTQSKQQIPHFYVTMEADMEEAIRMREWINSARPRDRQVSINDIIIKACAVTLLKHPTVNASYVDESNIEIHGSVNIGFAVAVPDGLIAPVVRNCETKTLSQISDEARVLIQKTRAGEIAPGDYESGTFTISNLGMYGVDEFVAIVNPPQAAILAVGAAMPKPVVVDGEVQVRHRMRLTVSGDHRVTDGARVAEFMRDLKKALESPMTLLE